MMIVADNISKSFTGLRGRKQVLENLSFEMPTGGHLAILGAEGTGKSTLLQMIGGLDVPDRGSLRRFGTVSWVTGRMRFEKNMTVSQNLRFIGRILGEKDFASTAAIVDDITEFGPLMREPFDVLTELQKKLLNFAVTLAFDFDIILIDGMPWGGPSVRQRIEPLLQEKMQRSMMVSVASKPAEISEDYTHILVLADHGGQLYDDRDIAFKAFNKEGRARDAGARKGRKKQEVVDQ